MSEPNPAQAPSEGPKQCGSDSHLQVGASFLDKGARPKTTTPCRGRGRARIRRPPTYLEDYVTDCMHRPPQLQREGGKPGKKSSIHSSSTGSSLRSRGSYQSLRESLDPIKQAKLEERLKSMELEEFHKQQAEEEQAETYYRQMDDQAREASRSREALTTRLSRSRTLRQLEREYAEVKMISSLLQEGTTNAEGQEEARRPDPPPQASPLPLQPQDINLAPPVQQTTYPAMQQISSVHLSPSSFPQPTYFPPQQPSQSTHDVSHYPPDAAGPQSASYPAQSQSFLQLTSKLASSSQQAMTQSHQTPSFEAHYTPQLDQNHNPPQQPWSQPSLNELLVAATYGIPKPRLPYFESGKESDFLLLKMAFKNLFSNQVHLSETYKYQLLLDHLKHPSAYKLARAYIYDQHPYSLAMRALEAKYGQPRQLIQSEITSILNAPAIKPGDHDAFEEFSLSVHALIGLLRSLEGDNGSEMRCGSHVDRLMSKLPANYRDSFVEHCLQRGIIQDGVEHGYTLQDLSTWLQTKAHAKRIANRAAVLNTPDRARKEMERMRISEPRKSNLKQATMYLTNAQKRNVLSVPEPTFNQSLKQKKPKFFPFCPFCNNKEHFLNSCPQFTQLTTTQKTQWITDNKRCWKCCRTHAPEACTLQKPCTVCKEIHLTILHDTIPAAQSTCMIVSTPSPHLFLDHPHRSPRVILKVVPVVLHYNDKHLETHAILDDGSERSIILPAAAKLLGLNGQPETLRLQTVRQEVLQVYGSSITFHISQPGDSSARFQVENAFTAKELSLAEHTCPVEALQQRYPHLRGLPLPQLHKAQPLVLIGSDHPHLVVPIQPICTGPRGAPIAVCTALGWTVQGPTGFPSDLPRSQQCLFTATPSSLDVNDLMRNVVKLWQLESFPHHNEKEVTRSKLDKYALQLLTTKTTPVRVQGQQRYATPLLRHPRFPAFRATQEAVTPLLLSMERRLTRDPCMVRVYKEEIGKLLDAGYVVKVDPESDPPSQESWFLPHHIVTQHGGKHRLVFNCSFQHHGQNLNASLLAGPNLGPSLLGVLLRFRQQPVAVTGDIKGMFHQVRLLPMDRPLLRFIWRDPEKEENPDVYEWQVLPFGTTCSPCCAIFALQQHARAHPEVKEEICRTIEQSFYVDNCLESVPTAGEARALVDNLRDFLSSGGFEIRQWACNVPSVIKHLPLTARSESSELWLSHSTDDPHEPTLGLKWSCCPDLLGYKHRPSNLPSSAVPTLRYIYHVLASQYDPLGYILPFTTRAKTLVQELWKTEKGWDDPIEPDHLAEQWRTWESELGYLSEVKFPRCYEPSCLDSFTTTRELHVFCDASERAYGSVAYLRSEDQQGQISVSFVMAKSRVAPKKQISMPRLELCAALSGAQLASLIQKELTLPIQTLTLWSDSTTVLRWLKSDSCRYKVFVGTRVAEIQELTTMEDWRYVDSIHNPADDLTRGKPLSDLTQPQRWSQGPPFLLLSNTQWPTLKLDGQEEEDTCELRKPTKIYSISLNPNSDPATLDVSQCKTWKEALQTAANYLTTSSMSDPDLTPETILLRKAQEDDFPAELAALQSGKTISPNSRLLSLAPEFDQSLGLIRVGGRLRRATGLDQDMVHPIILDPHHHLSQLLIKDYDERLLHPGPERVFGEIRRRYWLLRGRAAIRKHQHCCQICQRWRASPDIPRMADLPPARLRLLKPPFWSTGIDCFGPLTVKIGRRTEKRWGIIFKCMTTRCVHLDILESLDTDAFLLAFRRFISRRGRPHEVITDRGTNFRGGHTELERAFKSMTTSLQDKLKDHQVVFRFNPPSSPHFGGIWEREIRSVKDALRVVLGGQPVPDAVLRTVLIEVEGIMNSKPLGYVSSDVADPDPVTPNMLLMGRRDASLPQVVYCKEELIGKRRWRQSQILTDHFWASFIRHYLPNLQVRPKWRVDTCNLECGKVVLIVDPQLPRALWPIGRVVRTHPGPDGRVRTAEVKVETQTYLRPVARLIPLPEIKDEDDV